jgi:hypothetical protein
VGLLEHLFVLGVINVEDKGLSDAAAHSLVDLEVGQGDFLPAFGTTFSLTIRVHNSNNNPMIL